MTYSRIFYDGPSLINGAPILGVVSGLDLRSLNHKTGDMAQAWILLRDVAPNDAIAQGLDDAICGDCSLRGDGVHGRGCYVTYWQAPLNIWNYIQRSRHRENRDGPGGLTRAELATQLRGRAIRLGAYGDPTAIPLHVWRALLRHVTASIGYTQRWRVCDDGYRAFLMASVLSTVDAYEAREKGWRTYRVRGPRDPLAAGEVVCPASHEADDKLTCSECLLCSGAASKRQANPVIIAHGKAGNLRAFGINPLTFHRRQVSA